jgi:DNA-directed RNA polymerase specialized sigma24 family protein
VKGRFHAQRLSSSRPTSAAEIEKFHIDYHRFEIEREKQNAMYDRIYFDDRIRSSGTEPLSPARELDLFLFWRSLIVCSEYFRALADLNRLFGLTSQCIWDIQEIDEKLWLFAGCGKKEYNRLAERDYQRLVRVGRSILDENKPPFSVSRGFIATMADRARAQEEEGRDQFLRRQDLYETLLPNTVKATALFHVMLWKIALEGMSRPMAPIRSRQDEDEEYEPDLSTLQQVQKQMIYSFVTPSLAVGNYVSCLFIEASGADPDDRAFLRNNTIGRVMSLLSLTRNHRLREALRAENKDRLRDALRREVEAAPEINYRNWAEFSTLHTRVASRLIKELRPESSRLMKAEAATTAYLMDISEPRVDPFAEFEAREQARFLAEKLPGRQRDIFLATFEGRSDVEIAAELGISLEAVRVTRLRYRRKLAPLFPT